MGDVDVMLAAIDQLAGGGALSIEHGRSLVGVLHVATVALGIEDGVAHVRLPPDEHRRRDPRRDSWV